MNRRTSAKSPPEPLRRRGLVAAVELVPLDGDFRVRNAGRQLAALFGPELQQRLAVRAANKRLKEAQ